MWNNTQFYNNLPEAKFLPYILTLNLTENTFPLVVDRFLPIVAPWIAAKDRSTAFDLRTMKHNDVWNIPSLDFITINHYTINTIINCQRKIFYTKYLRIYTIMLENEYSLTYCELEYFPLSLITDCCISSCFLCLN